MTQAIHSLHYSSSLSTRRGRLVAGIAFSLAAMASQHAHAGPVPNLPDGLVVKSGNITATVDNSTKTETITQTTNTGIANWTNGFDVGKGYTVNVVLLGASARQLDRDISGNPSQILGTINMPNGGQLFLINSDGVLFGKNSQVNVGSLIASTADISNRNFNRGVFKFDRPGKDNASIINRGHITAAQGGLVALVAPNVVNDGVIEAKLGNVAIGGGNTATLDFYGDNLYSFSVGKSDKGGKVTNSGTISSGNVYITADTAKDVVDQVINNTGVIEATSAHSEGGTIVLDGGDGDVMVAGTVNASGTQGAAGGSITVKGKNITVDHNAQILAKGDSTGGSITIGSQNTQNVTTHSGSVIDVSSTSNDAGSVHIDSTDNTTLDGTINANGGSSIGNGGTVEASGATLSVNGAINANGSFENGGTVTLSGNDINVNAKIGAGGYTGGSINVNGGVGATTINNTLDASGFFNGGTINVSGNHVHLTNAATLLAQGNAIGGGTITIGSKTNTSSVMADNSSLIDASALLIGNGGSVNIDSTDNTILNGTINVNGGLLGGNGGNVSVTSNGTTAIHGAINAKAGGFFGGNGGTIETSGHVLNTSGATIDASAPNGMAGTWIVDPDAIVVTSTTGSDPNVSYIDPATINATLNTGTSVDLQATGTAPGSGYIDIASNISKTAGGDATLDLEASQDIILGGSPNNGSAESTGLSLSAGGLGQPGVPYDSSTSNVSITSSSGALNLIMNAGNGGNGGQAVVNHASYISTNGGDVSITGVGGNTINNSENPNASGVMINSSIIDAHNITINGSVINGASPNAYGVEVINSFLHANGDGAVNVTGSSHNNAGLRLLASNVESGSGAITLTGHSINGYGLIYGASSFYSDSGAINLNGDTVNGTYGIAPDAHIAGGNNIISVSGDITYDTGSNDMYLFSDNVATTGNITANTNNITLDGHSTFSAGSKAGTDILDTLNPVNPFGTNPAAPTTYGSTVPANPTGAVTINNTGVFASIDGINFGGSGVLNGDTVTLNQNGGNNTPISPDGVVHYFYSTPIAAPESSINNAINALGNYGTATLNLGAGTWNESVLLAKSNVTLNGQGASTVIAPTSAAMTVVTPAHIVVTRVNGRIVVTHVPAVFAPVVVNGAGGAVVVEGANNHINNLTIDATHTALPAGATSVSGLMLNNANGASINNNTINGGTTGISVNGGNNVTIIGNIIDNTINDGIDVYGSTNVAISNNLIGTGGNGSASTAGSEGSVGKDGIHLGNDNNVTISDNYIGVGGYGINGTGGTGIINGDGISASGNTNLTITGNFIGAGGVGIGGTGGAGSVGKDGIRLSNDNNVTVGYNWIGGDGVGGGIGHIGDVGVSATDETGLTIGGNSLNLGNIIENTAGDGIDVYGSSNAVISQNSLYTYNGGIGIVAGSDASGNVSNDVTITKNTIAGGSKGIKVSNLTDNGGNGNLISGNFVSGTNGDGIDGSNDTNLTIGSNFISYGGGINVSSDNNLTVENNTVIDGSINVSKLTGANSITGNQIGGIIIDDGIHASNAANLTISGNTIGNSSSFIGGNGIFVFGSDGAAITNNLVSNAATGISVLDSNNITLAGNTINGTGAGSVGINGIGSNNVTIADNTISDVDFGIVGNGGGNWTISDNTATGTTPGTGITGIVLNGTSETHGLTTTVGNGVFAGNNTLINFAEAPTGPTGPTGPASSFISSVIDQQFNLENSGNIPTANFSYPKQINTGVPGQNNFTTTQVNLSLLGNGNVGGNTPATAAALANLAPAAGGNLSPEQLAALAPAAGGNSSDLNCGNGFLSAGYSFNYSTGTCSTQ